LEEAIDLSSVWLHVSSGGGCGGGGGGESGDGGDDTTTSESAVGLGQIKIGSYVARRVIMLYTPTYRKGQQYGMGCLVIGTSHVCYTFDTGPLAAGLLF
jgi:hypothetical protein